MTYVKLHQWKALAETFRMICWTWAYLEKQPKYVTPPFWFQNQNRCSIPQNKGFRFYSECRQEIRATVEQIEAQGTYNPLYL